MNYFFAFWHSLYDAPWLSSRADSRRAAWKYFWAFNFALSLVYVVSAFFYLPALIKRVRQIDAANIPNFTFELNGGKLAVRDLPQPWIIERGDWALIVDTVSPTATVKNYLSKPEQDAVLVAATGVEVYDGRTGQTKVNPFEGMPNNSFSSRQASDLVASVKSSKTIAILCAVFAIGMFAAIGLSKLIGLVFAVFIVLMITKLAGKAWTLKRLFIVGLYSVTLPSLISLLGVALGYRVSYLYFLALLAFLLAVVFTKEGSEVKSLKSKV